MRSKTTNLKPNNAKPDTSRTDEALAAAQLAQANAEVIAEAAEAARANAEVIAAAARLAQANAESFAAALRTSELRYRRLFETARDGILILDVVTLQITDANPFMTELLGYSHDEFLGKELWEIGLLQNKKISQETFRKLQQEGYIRFEDLPLETRQGEPRDVEFVSNLYRENGHVVIQCNIRNIAERKTVEQLQDALLEREHIIATQLQAALQPELPVTVPGMALAKYSQPALEASEGVGGDFYDCYLLDADKMCVALVVGDLSGKGLIAAAQVAAVRHGLRTALFLGNTIAEAVTNLNHILIEQNALAAFATLFVGAFDSRSGELRYVICGQEPALVKRARTGAVEELASTGALLGCLQDAVFTEETVMLEAGDALAVFSDGLTEVGKTRLTMLGVEGVVALFGQPVLSETVLSAAEMAERLTTQVIGGVDKAAQGGVARDDVVLLVAVVERSGIL